MCAAATVSIDCAELDIMRVKHIWKTSIYNTTFKSPFVFPSFFINQSCICSLMSSLSSGTSCLYSMTGYIDKQINKFNSEAFK